MWYIMSDKMTIYRDPAKPNDGIVGEIDLSEKPGKKAVSKGSLQGRKVNHPNDVNLPTEQKISDKSVFKNVNK